MTRFTSARDSASSPCSARAAGSTSPYLRDTLELTDGNLSRKITRLQDAGYVKVDKVFEGRRPRTWLSATRAGRKALDAEVAALREIIAGLDLPPACGRAQRPLTEPT